MLLTNNDPFGGTCTLCGTEKATASWHCHSEVFVCRTCAASVLPALFADAMGIPGTRSIEHAARALAEFTGGFWYAIACQNAHQHPDVPKPTEDEYPS